MRLLRWLIGLALVAALAWAVLAVEFGGRTIYERVRSGGAAGSDPDQGPDAGIASQPKPTRPGLDAGAQAGAGAPSGEDHLTAEDRAGLDRLIQSKLEQGDGGRRAAPADSARP